MITDTLKMTKSNHKDMMGKIIMIEEPEPCIAPSRLLQLSKPGVEPGADLPAQGLQRALEYMWDTINALLWDKSKQRVGLPLAAACYVFDWYS
ncbi:hypothetical protein JWJ90_22580 [Desulfobulbus rhabdoformis]|uniref:hypothetical protein n=1 Tax=Desulfobulbus rhabdoformis TaxID=34032 RepID=UPI0019655E10|nr:hypothetical protein [Desulfobulbus rhabdoformis]MBM9617047.1 hypothetical protein [Desulfobulbus rhabdoformis]